MFQPAWLVWSTTLLIAGMAVYFTFPKFGRVAEYGGIVVAAIGVVIAILRVKPKGTLQIQPPDWIGRAAKLGKIDDRVEAPTYAGKR